MNRMILVPIDISDTELTDRVIKHVEAEARIDDAEVHFLTVIPSLPYYASTPQSCRRWMTSKPNRNRGSKRL